MAAVQTLREPEGILLSDYRRPACSERIGEDEKVKLLKIAELEEAFH